MNNACEQDRRGFPRYNLHVPITLTFAASGQDALDATALNLGLNGLYCTVTHYVPLFQKMLVTLVTTGDAEQRLTPQVLSQIEGVVVRVSPEEPHPDCAQYHLALYFQELSEQQEEAINTLITMYAQTIAEYEEALLT